MTISEKIQMLRKSRGLSQEQLAEQIGVTRQALSKWENGTVIPDTTNVIQMAQLFGVTTDYLLLEEYGAQESIASAINQNEAITKQQARLRKTVMGCFLAMMGALWMLMIWLPWLTGQVSVPYKEWFASFPSWLHRLFYTVGYLGQVNGILPFLLASAAIICGALTVWRSNKKRV